MKPLSLVISKLHTCGYRFLRFKTKLAVAPDDTLSSSEAKQSKTSSHRRAVHESPRITVSDKIFCSAEEKVTDVWDGLRVSKITAFFFL